MLITNTGQRRLSFVSFLGLFLLAMLIPCIAFINSNSLRSTLPEQELKEFQEKEKVLAQLSKLSDALRSYQTAQVQDLPSVPEMESTCRDLSRDVHSALRNKDTLKTYKDVNRFLSMADQYAAFIRQSSRASEPKIKELEQTNAQLLQEKMVLQNENQVLKVKDAAKPAGGGGGGAAVPAPVIMMQPSSGSGQASPQPVMAQSQAAPTSINDCVSQVNAYKGSVNKIAMMMQGNVRNIQTDVTSMSGFLVFAKNKKEKQSIEQNLKELNTALANLQGN